MSKKNLLYFLILITSFLFGCSDNVKISSSLEEVDTLQEEVLQLQETNLILINDDLPYTNRSHVVLTLFVFDENYQEMYITNDLTCESGGEWMPFSKTKKWILSASNAQVSVFAKFRNKEGEVSDCVSDDIIYDSIPPEVSWSGAPSLLPEETYFEFVATDKLSGLGDTFCRVNVNHNVDCSVEESFIVAPLQLVKGENEIVVEVFDKAGNMSLLDYQWAIVEERVVQVRRVHQSIVVENPKKQVDILFVIDNSVSMTVEHRHLAERLNNFLDHLVDLDWRIAVTSTNSDEYDKVEGSDGKLVSFPNGEYYIDHTLENSLAMSYLGETVVMDVVSSKVANCEQGIRGTYRAIERFNAKNVPNSWRFFREEAAVVVVLISDEDECGGDYKNKPHNLLQLVSDTWGTEKEFTFHSIIVESQECADESNHSVGTQYSMLSGMTGGVIGSVCATDYASQLGDMGLHVKNQTRSLSLECLPLDMNGDGDAKTDIDLRLGEDPLIDFTLDKATQSLLFPEILVEGAYKLDYYCEER